MNFSATSLLSDHGFFSAIWINLILDTGPVLSGYGVLKTKSGSGRGAILILAEPNARLAISNKTSKKKSQRFSPLC